jgi:hypothetical protein
MKIILNFYQKLRYGVSVKSWTKKKQNPTQPPNVNSEIDEGLVILRILEEQLWDTMEPSRVSLATSLDIIVMSIVSAQGKLTSIFYYRARMYEYYRTYLDINQVRDLGISKQQILKFLGILEMDKNYH